MATAPVTRGRAASATTKAAEAPAASDAQTKGISRREFLYYIWGASMALLMAESAGAIIWFSLPRFRAGEYGGIFTLDPSTLPAVGSPPVGRPDGKFWLSNTKNGLLALSMICTHLGCLFKWVDANNRFECPCHGSKFQADGTKIKGQGPAPRNLDRFVITVTKPGGTDKTNANGGPVNIEGATSIAVDTGKKIKGWPEGSAPQL
jgi:cytochrome b6-f complex iron-sulfur subunit